MIPFFYSHHEALNILARPPPPVENAISPVLAACPAILEPVYPALFLAAGCSAQSVSGKFTRPRTIIFDTNGALLILQQKANIAHVSGPVKSSNIHPRNYTAATSTVRSTNRLLVTNSTGTSMSTSLITQKSLNPTIPKVTNDDPTARSLLTAKHTYN
ncbi:uncharacterized protein EAF02_000543 [Botrytis sinoallii]|uniref:uncharacterized protein n=1 Tax=Botrytis sinoallii TaxID=1463999 RepID=UPI00190027A0|nr:uncharacterized protein EAF02_000543 [Botrytis sinoallii]KAF7893005.1 hypothetical protein EAF02_000543 [Botrytis sinoallii]